MAKQKKEWFRVDNSAPVPEIHVYGYIGINPEDVDYASFQEAFRNIANTYPECNIRINCYGGSVYDGLAIYDLMRSTDIKKNGIVEGMAASMGGIIAMGCDTIAMMPHARFMTHKVQSGAYGESDALRNTADDMDVLEARLMDIYAKRTGQPMDTVQSWFVSGKFTWHDAEACIKNGMANTVIKNDDEEMMDEMPDNALNDPKAAWEFYQNSYTPLQKQHKDTMKKQLILAMLLQHGMPANMLSENDTDEKFEQAIKDTLAKKDAQITALENKIKVDDEARVNALIDAAVTEGKILAGDKEQWKGFAKNDYAGAAFAISKLAGKPDISNMVDRNGKGAAGAQNGANERKDWTYGDWEKKDSKGLEKMMKDEPEKFNALFNAWFPKVEKNEADKTFSIAE